MKNGLKFKTTNIQDRLFGRTHTVKRRVKGKSSYAYIFALLEAYRRLPKVIAAIDKSVYSQALGSHNLLCGPVMPARRQVEDLVAVLNKKSELLDLGEAVQLAMRSLDANSVRLLYARYVHKMSVEQTAAACGISRTSVFRHSKDALEVFCRNLAAEGLDRERFEKIYLCQSWIKRIYVDMHAIDG